MKFTSALTATNPKKARGSKRQVEKISGNQSLISNFLGSLPRLSAAPTLKSVLESNAVHDQLVMQSTSAPTGTNPSKPSGSKRRFEKISGLQSSIFNVVGLSPLGPAPTLESWRESKAVRVDDDYDSDSCSSTWPRTDGVEGSQVASSFGVSLTFEDVFPARDHQTFDCTLTSKHTADFWSAAQLRDLYEQLAANKPAPAVSEATRMDATQDNYDRHVTGGYDMRLQDPLHSLAGPSCCNTMSVTPGQDQTT